MSRLQKLLGCLLVFLLMMSLAGNVALFFWGRQQARLAAERQAEIETLQEEIHDLRRQLRTSSPPDPVQLEETMDTLARQTEVLRDLQPQTPISRQLLSQQEMDRFISQLMEEEYGPQEARQDEIVLTAFELIPPDLDLQEMVNALLGEQVVGLYDPDDETLYVVSLQGDMGSLEKVTFAHEYTHALQDQYYDLEALGMGGQKTNYNDDQLAAIQALVEGDATFAMQQYMITHLKPIEVLGLVTQAASVDQEALNRAPPYLKQSFMFPYQEGLLFVTDLFQQGGWPAVDAAYDNLPQSTEQILHPERYPFDTPQVVSLPPLTDTLGSDWHLVDENVLGEFTLRAHLGIHLSQRQATEAADGWDGDRFAVYQNSAGQTLLVLSLVWDSQAEADDFASAYEEYAQAHFERSADKTGMGEVLWIGQDEALLIAAEPAHTLIVLAPSQEIATQVLQAFPRPQ